MQASRLYQVESSSPKAMPVPGSAEDTPALDAVFLSHSTFGDDALKGEIIALFRKQVTQAREQIAVAATASDWRFVMHTLKGAASAVGALQFAALAQEWEKAVFPSEGQRQLILNEFDLAKSAFLTAAKQV